MNALTWRVAWLAVGQPAKCPLCGEGEGREPGECEACDALWLLATGEVDSADAEDLTSWLRRGATAEDE